MINKAIVYKKLGSLCALAAIASGGTAVLLIAKGEIFGVVYSLPYVIFTCGVMVFEDKALLARKRQ